MNENETQDDATAVDYDDSSSDFDAVCDFMAEIDKFKRSKQNISKCSKTPSYIKPRKKHRARSCLETESFRRKKRKHKLFNPHPPKREDDDNDDNKKEKIVTPKQSEMFYSRLNDPKYLNPPKRKQKKNLDNESAREYQPTPLVTDDQVPDKFIELLTKSIERKNEIENARPAYEEAELEEIKKNQIRIDAVSSQKAYEKIKNIIMQAFPLEDKLTYPQLIDTFLDIGIVEQRRDGNYDSVKNIPELEVEMKTWEIKEKKETMYKTNVAKDALLNAIDDQETKFQKYVRSKIMISISNQKKKKETIDADDQRKAKSQMSYSTLYRLSRPKPTKEFLDDKCFEYHRNLPPMDSLSIETQEILKNSEIMKYDMPSRAIILDAQKKAKMEEIKMQEDNKEEYHYANPPPEYINQMQDDIKKRKEQKQLELQSLKNPPIGRPVVTKYEDYIKTKESMDVETSKPNGWNDFVYRHRKAHSKHMEEHLRKNPYPLYMSSPPIVPLDSGKSSKSSTPNSGKQKSKQNNQINSMNQRKKGTKV